MSLTYLHKNSTKTLMMKIINSLLSLLLCLFFSSCSKENDSEPIDLSLYTYVPDDNFEQLLIDQGYDDKMNDYVLNSKIKNIIELSAWGCVFSGGGASCSGVGIKDLTGIENFENLKILNVANNQLNYLDVSHNIYLQRLICYGNNISSLNLSNNTELEYLEIGNYVVLSYGNNITSIDLSNNVKLEDIHLNNNKLSNIDLSNNVNLKYLSCRNNNLSSLDISNNVNLTSMQSSLNTALECIQVNQNQLTNLTAYNYSSDPGVIYSLDCNYSFTVKQP